MEGLFKQVGKDLRTRSRTPYDQGGRKARMRLRACREFRRALQEKRTESCETSVWQLTLPDCSILHCKQKEVGGLEEKEVRSRKRDKRQASRHVREWRCDAEFHLVWVSQAGKPHVHARTLAVRSILAHPGLRSTARHRQ